VANQFYHNIAVRTHKPARAIPNMGTNGDESDDRFPSLFWITNPESTFVGNVASGSQDAGFWFEPLVRGPRKDEFVAAQNGERNDQKVPTLFKDNVARANLVSEAIQSVSSSLMFTEKNGVRLYPSGLKAVATKRAVFDKNTAILNRGNGFVTNRSANIDIRGWHFAENTGTWEPVA